MPTNATAETQTVRLIEKNEAAQYQGVLVPRDTFRYYQTKIDQTEEMVKQGRALREQERIEQEKNESMESKSRVYFYLSVFLFGFGLGAIALSR